jgi:hypothetical protein
MAFSCIQLKKYEGQAEASLRVFLNIDAVYFTLFSAKWNSKDRI